MVLRPREKTANTVQNSQDPGDNDTALETFLSFAYTNPSLATL